MNNLLERLSDAIMEYLPNSPDSLMGRFNPDDPTGYKWAKATSDLIAAAAITTICDEIDEGGLLEHLETSLAIVKDALETGQFYYEEKRSIASVLEDTITYFKTLAHLKSTTETKGAV